MNLIRKARSKTAVALFALASQVFWLIPTEFLDRIPSRLLIVILALGWTLSAWLATVALSYYLDSKLRADEHGILLRVG
jgi:predicted MFS family arabinose efflux permease